MIYKDINNTVMTNQKEKPFYTLTEIMEILQLSRLTLYRYIESGKLKSYKFGKDHRIKKEDFEDFLAQHKIKKKGEMVLLPKKLKPRF